MSCSPQPCPGTVPAMRRKHLALVWNPAAFDIRILKARAGQLHINRKWPFWVLEDTHGQEYRRGHSNQTLPLGLCTLGLSIDIRFEHGHDKRPIVGFQLRHCCDTPHLCWWSWEQDPAPISLFVPQL